MTVEVELPDGTILEAPDGVDPSAVAKKYLASKNKPVAPVGPPTLLDKALGVAKQQLHGAAVVGDVGLTGLSRGVVEPVLKGTVGLLAPSVQARREAQAWVGNNLGYPTQTQEGKAFANKAAQTINAVTQRALPVALSALPGMTPETANSAVAEGNAAITGVYHKLPQSVQGTLNQVGRTVSDAAAVLPAAGAVGKVAALAEVPEFAAGTAMTPLARAEALGLRITPSSVAHTTGASATKPSALGRSIETVTGRGSALLANAEHNKAGINDVIAQDLGMKPKTLLSDENLSALMSAPGKVHNEIRAAVTEPVPASPEFLTQLDKAGRGTESVDPLPPAVDAMKARYAQPMTSGQIMDTAADLKKKGWKAISAEGNPDLNAIGNVQLDMAKALEQRLEAALPDPMKGAYRAANKQFAKIYAAQDVKVGNDIDPLKLAKIAAKSSELDGGFAAVADVGRFFPHDVKLRPLPSGPGRTPIGLIDRTANFITEPVAKALLSTTRGEAKAPMLGPNGPLSYLYRSPAHKYERPNLELTPPPGRAFEPNQPELGHGMPDKQLDWIPGLELRKPPGEAFTPGQYDLFTQLVERLRKKKP